MTRPDTPKCGARLTKRTGTCNRSAGWGTDHPGYGLCKFHSGSTPNGKKHAARLYAMTLRDAVTVDDEKDLDHLEVMLRSVKVQAGLVEWARGQVAELSNDETTAPVGGSEHGHPRWEPHVLIRLRGEEEDRLVKLIKACHDMDIDQRRVRVMETAGEDLAMAIRGVLSDFGLLDDPRAPEIVRRHLLRLAGGDEDGALVLA